MGPGRKATLERSDDEPDMAISRRDALKRLNGLLPRVEEHLAKIADDPDHPSAAHWAYETAAWLAQMEEAASHVGTKTGGEWKARIAGFRGQLRR
jgi:hypothetical protein